ncbi:hypothetical protein MTHERMOG20_22880 [Moorella thermoacetica]|uniref:PIN domain-containing protein n=2 Tax=Neomoorella thermoacetica TaxID=1525 RepID=A0A1D7X6Y6_NEOTH|nr:type II toxin-antitoxin system VapC family toxin [Moorella thermoacetica]AKX93012.1 hypothetical protein MOTHE_c01950 [Moorella thermoacetica]AKX95564.1 hypothetical protein MOTHA_c01940 [Moorella thermoacetica]AOQ22681.1 hypothetical protein Maut_00198 [Moorella thermoacetica]OIQ10758.1 hypothetical protein MOOTH_23970 [Moorella thermoacetica]OIQ53725.1 hypothetical protein MOCA_24960 [Moorella thermoacetica]
MNEMDVRLKEVCVDACLVVKLVINEPDSALADALFAWWQEQGVQLIAPVFCPVEIDSVIRRRTVITTPEERLTPEQAEIAFEAVQAIPLKTISVPGQRRRGWELAKELKLPVVYDSHYLALAELRNCDFWTSDARLYNNVKGRLPYVHLLSEFASELMR